MHVENIALFRNTDLVPEAPATFEELETIALQLQSEGTVETPLAIQQAPTADPYHNYPMYSGGGGYVFDEPRRLAQPAGRRTGLRGRAGGRRAVGEVDGRGPRVGSVSQDIMKKVRNGQTPFAITGPWNLTDFVDAGVNFAVEPVPPIDGNPTRPFVGVQGFMISASRTTPTSPRASSRSSTTTWSVARLLRGPAATTGAIDAYDEVSSDPYIQGFGAAAIQGEAQPNIREMGAVWEAWTKAYQTIFNGGDGTQAFQDAAAEIDANIAAEGGVSGRPWAGRGEHRRFGANGRGPGVHGDRRPSPAAGIRGARHRSARRPQRSRPVGHPEGGRPEVLGRRRRHRRRPALVDVVYATRRFIPAKYLLPGSIFLVLFAVFPVVYTVYLSFTNYGTGHLITKPQAIDQIEANSVQALPGRARADIMETPDGELYLLLTDPSGAYFTGQVARWSRPTRAGADGEAAW